MPASAGLLFRVACPGDAQAIAALHAGSWQRHYCGAFSARLTTPDPRARTILAERDGTVGTPERSGAHPVSPTIRGGSVRCASRWLITQRGEECPTSGIPIDHERP